jgi:hypothetical protein
MELDDLKQSWKDNDSKQKPLHKNIIKMIQNKSYGPVAELKRAFRKQMSLMALLPILMFMVSLNDVHKALTSVLYWSYVVLCMGSLVFAYYNYRIADELQGMDGMVKSNLEKLVNLLQKRLKWNIIGLRLFTVLFIILLEVIPHFQHYSMLDKWHSLPTWARFSIYAGFMLFQYVMSPIVMQRKFGRHLNYLKDLVKEME